MMTIVFASATLLSGWSYLFCVPMQRAMDACCCHGTRDEGRTSTADETHVDRKCCEGRSLAKQASASPSETGVSVPNAPVVDVVPPPTLLGGEAPPRFVDLRRFDERARAGPPDRSAPLAAAPRFLLLCVQRC